MRGAWNAGRGRRGRRGVPTMLALLGLAVALAMGLAGRVEGVRAAAAPVPGRVTGVREADAACARCHAAIFAKYVGSPMANGSGLAEEHLLPGAMRHAGSGMTYRVAMVAGRPTLEYAKAGDAAVQGSRRLEYFLGSGRLGTTYLYSEGGYLLESPVAWYAHLQGYAMAPGLEAVTAMPAALPMEPGCMRCHMSDVRAADGGSRNHFAGLPFLHGGVTCEGCHGDATAHVASGGRAAVVNPLKLDAVRRDSVCASCHLEGDVSVDRRGRTATEYRPGDRLDAFATHFVFRRDSTSRSVSETEQLLTSRCKRESGDRMSCMSCHDAHGDPAPETRVAFYRAKCLACHGAAGTSAGETAGAGAAGFARTHFPEQPDCTACHMPKNGATDTPHVAWTDHRLLQRPGIGPEVGPTAAAGTGLALGGIAGAATRETLEPVEASEAATPRDLALAYYTAMNKGRTELAGEAWTRLNAVAAGNSGEPGQPGNSKVSKVPKDPAVLVALGYMNAMGGRLPQARALLEEALRLEPEDVEARSDEATLLARAGELLAAVTAERAVFGQNEDVETLGVNLALLECAAGQQQQAQETLRTVLRFSPDSARARAARTQCGAGGDDAR